MLNTTVDSPSYEKVSESSEKWTQQKLSDLSCNPSLIKAAEEIIEKGSCIVSKPVRAGMTTSIIMACERKGLKVLALAPTRRILKETVAKAASDAVRIPGNSECPLIENDLRKNPILRQLPLTLPNCEKCNASCWCEVLAILRNDASVMSLTYTKLEALMLSQGRTAKQILSKISKADVVLLDECHELALPKAVSVKSFTTLDIPEKYTVLIRIYQQWLTFCQSHVEIIQELIERAEKGHAGQHLAKGVSNLNCLDWRELKKAWNQLRKLAVAHELPDDKVIGRFLFTCVAEIVFRIRAFFDLIMSNFLNYSPFSFNSSIATAMFR